MTVLKNAPRAKERWVVLTFALTAMMSLVFGTVLAVHDENLFELGGIQEADILGDGVSTNGPDWADIFDADGDVVSLAGGVAASFLNDDTSQKAALDATTFSGAGGSNKNGDPIGADDCAAYTPPLTGSACDTWHWDSGNVPAKDDLKNVYAYATFNAADELIIYAGFERLDPSGDSHIDVEFFTSPVALSEDKPCNDPGNDPTPCFFTGIRQDGDIVVSMDFVQGGGIGSITIHQWDSAASEFFDLTVLGGEGCNALDTICAFNNGENIDGGPWVNLNRHGAEITNIAQNGFTEFGINATQLLGETPCISTFMGKTRSSQSFTAELKDFAGPESFNICGADIQIGTDDTNEVGQPHTFTVTVNKVLGGQSSPVADGTIVDVDLTDANGADNEISDDNCADPGTVGGICTITFTSDSPGTVTAHASATVSFGPLDFFVETDGEGTNSGDAVKTFVDAYITITPTETNEVGASHTFTVTVKQNDGSGATYTNAPDGTPVTVTLTAANNAVIEDLTDTCASPGTSGGSCTVTFKSDVGGTVTGHAAVDLTLASLLVHRETDGAAPNSGDAVKTYVDAYITIGSDDTNSIGESHTFTINVFQDDGSGLGYVAVPDDTLVAVTLTGAGGASAINTSNNCDAPDGTSGGSCSITFTSNTAGTITGHAEVDLTLAGQAVHRETGDGLSLDSADAVKTFIAGSLFWEKRYAGELQGGATFEVCRTHNYDTTAANDGDPGTPAFVNIADVCITVVDDTDGTGGPGADKDGDGGQFLLTTLVLGRYTVDETAAPPGFEMDPKVETVDVISAVRVEITDDWDNQRPIVKITGFGYTNAPEGTPTLGVTHGTAVFTVTLHNYGGASGTLSGSLAVAKVGAGTLVCTPVSPVPIGGAIAADDNALGGADDRQFTISCEYDLADGSTVTGTLNVSYAINGLTRVASGSPATITFTVQGD